MRLLWGDNIDCWAKNVLQFDLLDTNYLTDRETRKAILFWGENTCDEARKIMFFWKKRLPRPRMSKSLNCLRWLSRKHPDCEERKWRNHGLTSERRHGSFVKNEEQAILKVRNQTNIVLGLHRIKTLPPCPFWEAIFSKKRAGLSSKYPPLPYSIFAFWPSKGRSKRTGNR